MKFIIKAYPEMIEVRDNVSAFYTYMEEDIVVFYGSAGADHLEINWWSRITAYTYCKHVQLHTTLQLVQHMIIPKLKFKHFTFISYGKNTPKMT